MKLSEWSGDAQPAEQPKSLKLSEFGADPAAGTTGSQSDLSKMFQSFLAGAAAIPHGVEMAGREVEHLAQHATPSLFMGAQGRQKVLGDVESGMQQSQQAFEQRPQVQAEPRASRIGQIVGEALPSAAAGVAGPAMRAAGMAPRVAQAAPSLLRSMMGGGAGAAAGTAAAPVMPPQGQPAGQSMPARDYWSEKGKQALTASVGGVGMSGVGHAIGPPLSQATRSVIDNFPHLASILRGTSMRTPDNMNRAVVSQALDPIGIKVPQNISAGHNLIEFGRDRFDETYNRVLSNLSLRSTPEFSLKGMAEIKEAGDEVLDKYRGDFDSLIKKYIEKPLLDNRGLLEGDALKRAQNGLGTKADALMKSHEVGEQELGTALHDARSILMDHVADQNPDWAVALRKTDDAYAMFSRVKLAAGRRADSGEVFTPQDMMVAAKVGTKPGRRLTQAGDMMRAMGEATKGPMSTPKVNRILTSIIGSALGSGMGLHGVGGGAVVGAAGPEIAGAAIRATQHPISRGVGATARGLAPAGGAALGIARTPTPADRVKAVGKVSQLQTDLYNAKRKGDLDGTRDLMRQLADAQDEYRQIAPRTRFA